MSYSAEICELLKSNDRVGVGPQASNPRLEFAKERSSFPTRILSLVLSGLSFLSEHHRAYPNFCFLNRRDSIAVAAFFGV